MRRLTAGLVCSGNSFVLPDLLLGNGESLLRWESGIWRQSLSRFTLDDGTAFYIHSADGIDDFRQTLYGPKAIVEAAWREWAKRVQVTPEAAAEWLAKYRGCAGQEAYEYIAAGGAQ